MLCIIRGHDSGAELLLRTPDLQNAAGDYIGEAGIGGWFDTPGVREEAVDVEGTTGDLFPAHFTQPHRVLTIPGIAACNTSLEAARHMEKINSLMGQKLTVSVRDTLGQREVEGFLANSPEQKLHYPDAAFEYVLNIVCPDPYKYSTWNEKSFNVGTPEHWSEVFDIQNTGSAPTFPKAQVWYQGSSSLSPMLSIVLSSNNTQKRFDWYSEPISYSRNLEVDFSSMVIAWGHLNYELGGNTQDFTLEPGQTTVEIQSTAANMTFSWRSGWR